MSTPINDDGRETADSFNDLVRAFITLQFVGGCGLAIILLTALLSPRLKRYKTWYSFMVSWLVSVVSYTLLTFAGQQTREQPTFGLCLMQGALVYAAPPLAGATTLALAIHTFLNMQYLLNKVTYPLHRLTIYTLIVTPWIIWTFILVGGAMWGAHYPETVLLNKNGTYCSYRDSQFSALSSYMVVGLTIGIIGVEGIIGFSLFRHRHMISGSGYSLTMALRVMAFSICGALALGLAIAWLAANSRGQVFDIVLSTLPVEGFLIFGSQSDLISVWTFGRVQLHDQRSSTVSARKTMISTSESA